MDVFGWLAIGVIIFLAVRIIYEAFVKTMKGHTEPPDTCPRCQELYCEDCKKKQESSDTSEQAEWCDCPQRPTSDKHSDE